MKRWEISIVIGMIVSMFFASFGAFGSECEEVRGQVLRLHVLANSNSEDDQSLKLAVRDAVLEESVLFLPTDVRDKHELEQIALEHMDELEDIARKKARELGYEYDVSARLINMYFETRSYGDITLPAGYYDAVRLTIGSGEGENWWCVMFPPMCVPAASKEKPLPLEQRLANLGEETTYIPKLAVVELIEKLRG